MSASQPRGHLAAPAGGKGSPVLVLHAWWGLNDNLKAWCDRLADAGFVAFAPDLYDGRLATTIPEAEALSRALDADRASTGILDALRFLEERTDATRGVAVVGFSLGGWFALELSVNEPARIGKVVVYYSSGPGDYAASRASYLGHFAEEDPFEPREGIEELEANLRRAGRPVAFHVYPGTGHWFAEPDRTGAYDAVAAELAWERTLEFLRG